MSAFVVAIRVCSTYLCWSSVYATGKTKASWKIARQMDRWSGEGYKDVGIRRCWATVISHWGWRENGRRPRLSLSYSANDDGHDDDTGNDYDDFRLKWMSIN